MPSFITMPRRALPLLLAPALVALGASASPAPAVPIKLPIVVTNTNDAGPGSLRDAITTANTRAGHNTITFAIPGMGPHVITPVTDLPAVTDPVTIDGYTQAGALPAAKGALADLRVVVDAQNMSVGLDVQFSSTVKGLVIHSAADMATNSADAIRISGDGNVVQGNYLGTDAAGQASLLNDQGIQIDGADNVVGGSTPADCNVIGADFDCVIVPGGSRGRNQIVGNRIGTTADGTAGLGGAAGFAISYGVMIEDSDGNVVNDNLISDMFVGVEVWGDDTILQGNKIGTDATGTVVIPSGLGMNIEGGDDNQIGGTGLGDGNLVSGNEFGGIQLEPGLDGFADRNVLEGNKIGTDVTGTIALPNGISVFALPGISVVNASDNVIGGTDPAAANLISGNDGNGVDIFGSDAQGNLILGNRIGTDVTGLLDLGNGESGVRIEYSQGNQVGDVDPAHPVNTIAYNDLDGVTVLEGTGNTILRNSIFLNGGLGIDLDDDGVSANDPAPDADGGANDLQNTPVIAAATSNAITWTLDSRPLQTFRIEFYADPQCGVVKHFAEGRTFLGSTEVVTDGNGHAAGVTVPSVPPRPGTNVVGSATLDIDGVLIETSEFSPCLAVT